MGVLITKLAADYTIQIKTGDKKGAGTDANVWLVLYDNKGLKTIAVKLKTFILNSNERNKISTFQFLCPGSFQKVDRMEIWRDTFGIGDSWYLEYMAVERKKDHARTLFPINRWILPNRKYNFGLNDCILPQLDTFMTQRVQELDDRKKLYEFTEHIEGGPLQIKSLPEEEDFRYMYQWDFSAIIKKEMLSKTLLGKSERKWETICEMKLFFSDKYPEPSHICRWDDDSWFAMQRLQGLNPISIKLCTEIPEKFGVDVSELEQLLDHKELLQNALDNRKIFIVDHSILKNLPCKDDKMICAPIALFYLNRKRELVPIAIQLFQDKGSDNPVFFPTDPPYTWLLAKMYFNNADAAYHRACLSIGRVHLLTESLWVSINRNLSPSHPLYKLMAPHFHRLLTVNKIIVEKLLVMGGWIDKVTTTGARGLCHLIARRYPEFRFDQELNIPKEIESRGVNDPEVLPYYPYRDDVIILYDIIHEYVGKIIKNHYDEPKKVSGDMELQNWRKELVRSKKKGGCEIKGLPGNDGGFFSRVQVLDVVVGIIANCTIFHSAIDLAQYEECAFIPNYPLSLLGPILRDKRALAEKDIIEQLPDMEISLDIVNAVKIFSSEKGPRLGHDETVYLTNNQDIKAHKEFVDELNYTSDLLKKRNEYRKCAYKWMDPDVIPNHIVA